MLSLDDKTSLSIKYIIIDEYSTLGQTSFAWTDKCCRQATGLSYELFGGLSIILFSDPGQLPPVGDKPLYHSNPSSSLGHQRYLAYQMFTLVFKLSINQRVQGVNIVQTQFRNLPMGLRTGDSTEADWHLLKTRQPSGFHDATRLYFQNEDVGLFIYNSLTALHQPIASTNARHSSSLAKSATADHMLGLEPVIFLTKGAYYIFIF